MRQRYAFLHSFTMYWSERSLLTRPNAPCKRSSIEVATKKKTTKKPKIKHCTLRKSKLVLQTPINKSLNTREGRIVIIIINIVLVRMFGR